MKLYSHEGDKLPENRMFHHTVARIHWNVIHHM